MTPMISAPTMVPQIVPMPPLKLVPPMTAAVMASSSIADAQLGWPEPMRAASTMPARPASRPARV